MVCMVHILNVILYVCLFMHLLHLLVCMVCTGFGMHLNIMELLAIIGLCWFDLSVSACV